MQIVILGAGVVGFQIASNLISEGKDVVLIEKDPARAKYVSNHLDCIVLNEEGNNLLTLKRSGITKADFFISVTNSDEVNMIACGLVASEFDVPIKIARVRNLEYSGSRILENTFLGINYIVNSEVETSRAIINTVEHGATSNIMLFDESQVQMRNIIIDSDSPLKDKKIMNVNKELKSEFLIAGILRDDDIIIPSGETQIIENDNLYLIAKKDQIQRIFKRAGKLQQKIEKIVLVGGGRIGKLVAKQLIELGNKVTMIDSSYENCKELSEMYPDALILNADISDDEIFNEEQLYDYDLIITTTNNQEMNILSAVFAKSLGTKRAIALVTKSNYITISSRLAIDSTISPKTSTVDAILKFIRQGTIKSVHTIFDGKAEVIEFLIPETSEIAGQMIKDLILPGDSLILSVSRKGEDFIPSGNFIIEVNDTVITIAKKDVISKLEKVFMN